MSQIVAIQLRNRPLTSKSITEQIKERIAELHGKELFYLPQRYGGIGIRTLIVSNEVKHDVTPPYPETREGVWLETFRASLDQYSSGRRSTLGFHPTKKPPHSFMARTGHPTINDIWDIRSVGSDDGVRCFGGWGGHNLFVALTWEYRKDLDFVAETKRARDEWDRLFPGLSPFAGKNPDDYGSNFVDY